MKTERPYPFVTIDARGTKRAQEGHPWVFDNEITAQKGTPEDGALCDVRSPGGGIWHEVYNSHSKTRCGCSLKTPTTGLTGPFSPGGPSTPGTTKDVRDRARQLPRHLWGGGPLPRPDRGQVWGHPGHPNSVPGHRAAQAGSSPPWYRPSRPAESTSGAFMSATT